ncbi:hypothetical protein QMK19_00630 [Streptomyces sp. H10-C2]|uniref:hypothetical protein n=1 Tax=unclassified Streptomyces TaxID=2593676 RepID=UPI0024B976F7|nr:MULTISPECIES: hypothetical protein [unclassified Streptomyces]MDJ0340325.1 hypothetical protein [Streptomyces sp. PH10-H1]MDJ0368227.1 hypothetical protein [Streptomyces sp. H10-C2]
MTAAGGLALIIIGAILRYAITWHPRGIDLGILGNICMLGGAAGLLIGVLLAFTRRRRPSQHRYDTERVYEQRYYEDPPRP